MSYIKINKDSLDYDYHARFHSYTMNCFVRNIMRNGKYKKALRIARSGLLWALKRIREGLMKGYLGSNAVYNTREAIVSRLANSTQNKIIDTLNVYKNTNILDDIMDPKKKKEKEKKKKILPEGSNIPYYTTLIRNLRKTKFNYARSLKKIKKKNRLNFSVKNRLNFSIKNSHDFSVENIDQKGKVYSDGIVDTEESFLTLDEQYGKLKEELEFQKIYTKRPRAYFIKNRKYTIFDMIIQAYAAVANVWAMRKIKVSGRTVLVPTPLRPYRRISVVTQMIMIGIRQLRKEERFFKNAMIKSIATEFFYILFYYDPIRVKPNITASKIWQLKLKSQKELVANLKNIKHTIYT